MPEPKTICIDDVEYVRKDSCQEPSGDIKIVILQRGWAMVGILERDGSECKLHKSAVIRKWGTSQGLGELAKKGPLTNTVLDKNSGVVEFDYLTVVAAISCEVAKWQKEL